MCQHQPGYKQRGRWPHSYAPPRRCALRLGIPRIPFWSSATNQTNTFHCPDLSIIDVKAFGWSLSNIARYNNQHNNEVTKKKQEVTRHAFTRINSYTLSLSHLKKPLSPLYFILSLNILYNLKKNNRLWLKHITGLYTWLLVCIFR